MNSQMNETLILCSFSHPYEAHLALALLDSHGIDAVLQDEHTVFANHLYSNAIGGVKLVVGKEDFEKALEVLKSSGVIKDPTTGVKQKVEVLESDSETDKTKCPFCQSDNISVEHRMSSRIAQMISSIVSTILLAPVKVWSASYKCFDCGKEWRFFRR